MARRRRNLLERLRHLERVRPALELARPGDEREGQRRAEAGRERPLADLNDGIVAQRDVPLSAARNRTATRGAMDQNALRGLVASGRLRARASYAKTVQWLTKLRLLVLGHEELTAIIFWAALIGIAGALASVAFRECIHAFEWMITGSTTGRLVGGGHGAARRCVAPSFP